MTRHWTAEKMAEWNQEVFQRESADDFKGILNHARREIDELIHAHTMVMDEPDEAVLHVNLCSEVADLFILLETYAYFMKINVDREVDNKMEINVHRSWGKADAEGVVEHIDNSDVGC